jgi:hypothetical protein
MKSILDPSFSYTSSLETDVRETFARIRREQQKREIASPSTLGERNSNMLTLQRAPTSLQGAARARTMQESGRARPG